MLKSILKKMTFANVISLTALFIALGGSAYAVTQIDRNSVQSKHIVNGQVKEADLGDGSVTAGKVSGDVFNDEALRLVSAVGQPEPAFKSAGGQCPWSNYDEQHPPAGFYRDPLGIVHMQGYVKATSGEGDGCSQPGSDTIFSLPAGYTPAKPSLFPVISNHHAGGINVDPGGLVSANPDLISVQDMQTYVTLDGISFRCAPSGVAGCP